MPRSFRAQAFRRKQSTCIAQVQGVVATPVVWMEIKMIIESFGRCSPAEGLSGKAVERSRDGFEVARAVLGKVSSFRKVLA